MISVPLILENITCTVDLPGAEMDEGEFLAEVLGRSGCGMLLDVANVYTNAVNHGGDALALLEALPLDRVVQLHFAGGHTRDGMLVDSHAHATPAEVWRLLEAAVEQAPVKGIILERDENLPALTELLPELDRARSIAARAGRWA